MMKNLVLFGTGITSPIDPEGKYKLHFAEPKSNEVTNKNSTKDRQLFMARNF